MKILDKFLIHHRKRIVGLDILRSFAIFFVVYYHGRFLIPPENRILYDKIQPFKIDGVSIFFVLSGFLIGGILLKIINKTDFKRKDLLNFWIRRWFRTIPNYLFVLSLLLISSYIARNNFGDFNLKYFIFSQNLFSPHPNFFPEAWSLAIEEWFYLLFPLSCYIIHKLLNNKTKSILISAIFFILIPLIIRIIKFENGIIINDFDAEFRKVVIYRLDSIMYGVIAAYVLYKYPEFWKKSKLYFLFSGIFLILLLNIEVLNLKYLYEPLFFNIESITTFCFIPFLSTYKSTKFKFLDSFFIFISIISYSMYLLNLTPVQRVLLPTLNKLLGRTELFSTDVYITNYIAFWFFTIVGSYVLYTIFENPVTKFRDRIKL